MKKQFCLLFGLGVFTLVTSTSAQTNIFPENGNVGIGTSSPSEKLQVNGRIMGDGVISVSNSYVPSGFYQYFDYGVTNNFAIGKSGNNLTYLSTGLHDFNSSINVHGNISTSGTVTVTGVPISSYDVIRLGDLGVRVNWTNTLSNTLVVSQLGWKNYGNNHTIVDMSNGYAPNGTEHNQSNADYAWNPSYPTLMGWNGNSTYGVRVDNARLADKALKWGEENYNPAIGGVPSVLMGFNSGVWTPVTPTHAKTFLATSLQEVTSVNNTITGTELIRGIGTNAYFSAFDSSNEKRSGYLYFGAGDNITIEAENGVNKILLNPNTGGKVGIGTNTPQEKLSVNGKIRAHEIKIDASNWPDYVFEDDYKIASLKDLENYIKTNKHLPDMPSAKEVDLNGVALGEMNKLLLKKLEELTLYMIDLKKENTELKNRIDKIENKN